MQEKNQLVAEVIKKLNNLVKEKESYSYELSDAGELEKAIFFTAEVKGIRSSIKVIEAGFNNIRGDSK